MMNPLPAIRSIARTPFRRIGAALGRRGGLLNSSRTRPSIEIRHRQTHELLARIAAASLGGLNLQGQNLEGGDLDAAWMLGVCLRGANLRGAGLRGATLLQADLQGADLQGAVLTGADLTGASLRNANLCGADLDAADLTDTLLQHAGYDDRTRWPADFEPQGRGMIRRERDPKSERGPAAPLTLSGGAGASLPAPTDRFLSAHRPHWLPRAFSR